MSNLTELLADCDAGGIRLHPAVNGGLTIDGPQAAMTPDLLDRLRTNKGELLALLRPVAAADGDALTILDAIVTALIEREAALAIDPAAVLPSLPVLDDQQRATVRMLFDDCAAANDDGEEIAPPPPCPECGSLDLWQNLLGDWRCQHCDAAALERSRKVLDQATLLRQQSRRRASARRGGNA